MSEHDEFPESASDLELGIRVSKLYDSMQMLNLKFKRQVRVLKFLVWFELAVLMFIIVHIARGRG